MGKRIRRATVAKRSCQRAEEARDSFGRAQVGFFFGRTKIIAMVQLPPPQNEAVLEMLDGYAYSKYSQYFHEPCSQPPGRGPVEIDYWSISYRVTFPERSLFVKIPKVDMCQADLSLIVADPGAQESARTEFDGFSQIYGIRDWPKGCAAVRPLEYVPSFNSIITEFVPSNDLFRQCRHAAIGGGLAVVPSSGSVPISLGRCGAWLRHFQRAHECEGTVRVSSEQLLVEMENWARQIQCLCIRPRKLDALLARLERSRWSHEIDTARTCEGFEVRNIIVDPHGTVRLVDPGRISWGSGLEDVAHFLVSLTMLFWGTSRLWLGIPMSRPYRHAFLNGWAPRDRRPKPSTLAWFETRELFRQWLEAYRVLSRKPYPRTLGRFLRAVYVDAFFLNRITQTVAIACN